MKTADKKARSAPKSEKVTMTAHRVTFKTRPPYLFRIKIMGDPSRPPIIATMLTVEASDSFPFGRAVVVQSPCKFGDYQIGSKIRVDNFRAIERLSFPDIPGVKY